MTDNACVKVAVRIRPQIHRDIVDLCHVCTTVVPNEPQIWLGKDKAFTFDDVFDMPTTQEEIYEKCVKDLIQGCFQGYNATVLAYGQTGSGKTYTMGTGFDLNLNHSERGIIPRAVEHLFREITRQQNEARECGLTPPEFKVNAQFMELYNEEIIDLLETGRDNEDKNKRAHIKIHEDSEGQIYTVGVIAQCVTSVEEALQVLKLGSLSRTTASTGMNLQSSRSHAIFTLHIKQQRVVRMMPMEHDSCNSNQHDHSDVLSEFETLTAKFHFVDLAGSERLKRTRATGERQKEGISINSGLLALGNVISALGDKSRKITHVPYRDSKLTRLLQDSLGGNSRTLMIACISPSDRDFMETLNTLKYANRAKNIKNKVTVNMDKTSQTISMLRKEVESLRHELIEYKQGKRIVREDGSECINDMYHENTMLQTENNTLKTRVKALQETVERLTVKNTELLSEKAAGNWVISENGTSEIAPLIQDYIREIETLRAKLLESEEVCSYLRKHYCKPTSRLSASPTSTVAITGPYDIRMDSPPSVYELLEEAREDVRQLKKKKKKIKISSMEKKLKGGGEENEKDIDEKEINEKDEINEDDEDLNEDSSSDSNEDEGEEEPENYSENLAGLTCEISMKEKLIQQVEMSQRRLQNMRQRYEEKIIQLQNKIQETEKERDKFLSNLSKGSESQHSDKARRVNEDFERKLSALKNDMKHMQAAKKEHSQVMRTQGDYERQLKNLKNEVAEMKRAKVALINKMKEEAKKHKEAEKIRTKEIAELKRDGRNKETQIRSLQAEKKVKEAVLKRKQEEVIALRRRNKAAATKKPVHSKGPYSRNSVFSPKLAKQKWQNLEKKITKLVLNKLSVFNIEKDMERWLQEREKLSRCLEKVRRKRDRALMDGKQEDEVMDLEEEMENLQANIEYIHENIGDCQTSIMQLEETKDDMDAVDIANTLKNMQLEESRYLIEKLLNMAINQSMQAAQREIAVKELESQLKQVIENNAIQEQLLLHVVHQANENISGMIDSNFVAQGDEDVENSTENPPLSPMDSSLDSERRLTYVVDTPRKKKAREMAATAEELLFSGSMDQGAGDSSSENGNRLMGLHDPLLDFPSKPSEAVISWRQSDDDDEVMNSRSGLGSRFGRNTSEYSEGLRSSFRDGTATEGELIPFSMKSERMQTSLYLICTYVAEGHTQGVLSLECTDDVLFSSSKDCTVKIWDLTTGKDIQQLSGHPSAVGKVRYNEYTRLAFTASLSYVKIWDIRQKPLSCIHTLCSSGISKAGSMASESLGHGVPPGENQINDIALSHYGTTLFSASTGSIRMFDLRMYRSVGALKAGFQAVVNCLAVDDMALEKNLVVSGSRDHEIKVFEVMDDSRGIHSPISVLTPPHYDSIQGLSISGDFLFSASKDSCIKKWDLEKGRVEKSLQRAHTDSLRALNVVPSGTLFLTGCRSGYLTLWSADRCERLEVLRAHGSSINAIASNETCMFTASNDSTVGIWTLGDRNSTSPPEEDFRNLNLLP